MNLRYSPMVQQAFAFLDKYSILISAFAIYAYYLLTSIDLLVHHEVKKSFLDYLLQFDSLIFMWVIAAVILQLQKYRKQQAEENEYRRNVEREFERQRMHLHVLDDITQSLQERVNNPLATISISSHTIRRKHESDIEITSWLDRIDTSLKSIHASISEMKATQLEKIVEESLPPRAPLRMLA